MKKARPYYSEDLNLKRKYILPKLIYQKRGCEARGGEEEEWGGGASNTPPSLLTTKLINIQYFYTIVHSFGTYIISMNFSQNFLISTFSENRKEPPNLNLLSLTFQLDGVELN